MYEINRALLKDRAKSNIQGNMGMLIVCFLIVEAIMMGVAFIPYVGTIAQIAIAGPFALGTAYIYVNLRSRYAPDVNVLFSAFQRFGDCLSLYLLYSVFTMLWSFLLVVPGIIKAIGWSQIWYISAENPNMSAKEVMEKSAEMMDGYKMEYFKLTLSFIPWMMLCCVTCGIALFYVIPYMNATYVEFYYNLKDLTSPNFEQYDKEQQFQE